MREMVIQLEDLRQPTWRPLYLGDQPRYATATSVRFLDERRIVCCSLLARKIYLIRFDLEGGGFELLDRADTTFEGALTETDLCDIDEEGFVVTSNCKLASMTLYRVVDDKIRLERDLPTRLASYCHGARFLDKTTVAGTMLNDPMGIYFFDRATLRQDLYVPTTCLPKDICFPAYRRALLIATTSQPLPTSTNSRHITEAQIIEIDLARRQYRPLARRQYGHGQFDSVAVDKQRAYIADSHRGCVFVIDARTLQRIDRLEGYAFPHGVDVKHGLLAVACYGTNAIHVRELAPRP